MSLVLFGFVLCAVPATIVGAIIYAVRHARAGRSAQARQPFINELRRVIGQLNADTSFSGLTATTSQNAFNAGNDLHVYWIPATETHKGDLEAIRHGIRVTVGQSVEGQPIGFCVEMYRPGSRWKYPSRVAWTDDELLAPFADGLDLAIKGWVHRYQAMLASRAQARPAVPGRRLPGC